MPKQRVNSISYRALDAALDSARQARSDFIRSLVLRLIARRRTALVMPNQDSGRPKAHPGRKHLAGHPV